MIFERRRKVGGQSKEARETRVRERQNGEKKRETK
jgi:hypothetical protein